MSKTDEIFQQIEAKENVYKLGNISFVLSIYIFFSNHLCQTEHSQTQNKHLSVNSSDQSVLHF